MGSSTSSNRGGCTPFFTSPKSSTVNLPQSGLTPFASLSDCPFGEAEAACAVEALASAQPPPLASTSEQQQSQVGS